MRESRVFLWTVVLASAACGSRDDSTKDEATGSTQSAVDDGTDDNGNQQLGDAPENSRVVRHHRDRTARLKTG